MAWEVVAAAAAWSRPRPPSHIHPPTRPHLRFRTDTLLGLASVPLIPLLRDCWVDGYAPVQVRRVWEQV